MTCPGFGTSLEVATSFEWSARHRVGVPRVGVPRTAGGHGLTRVRATRSRVVGTASLEFWARFAPVVGTVSRVVGSATLVWVSDGGGVSPGTRRLSGRS